MRFPLTCKTPLLFFLPSAPCSSFDAPIVPLGGLTSVSAETSGAKRRLRGERRSFRVWGCYLIGPRWRAGKVGRHGGHPSSWVFERRCRTSRQKGGTAVSAFYDCAVETSSMRNPKVPCMACVSLAIEKPTGLRLQICPINPRGRVVVRPRAGTLTESSAEEAAEGTRCREREKYMMMWDPFAHFFGKAATGLRTAVRT